VARSLHFTNRPDTFAQTVSSNLKESACKRAADHTISTATTTVLIYEKGDPDQGAPTTFRSGSFFDENMLPVSTSVVPNINDWNASGSHVRL
jgi:hypothetical protein